MFSCICILVPSVKWKGNYLSMGQKSSSLVLQCLLLQAVPVRLLGRIKAAFFLSAEHIRKLKPRGFSCWRKCPETWWNGGRASLLSTWPLLRYKLGKHLGLYFYPAGSNPRSRLSLPGQMDSTICPPHNSLVSEIVFFVPICLLCLHMSFCLWDLPHTREIPPNFYCMMSKWPLPLCHLQWS